MCEPTQHKPTQNKNNPNINPTSSNTMIHIQAFCIVSENLNKTNQNAQIQNNRSMNIHFGCRYAHAHARYQNAKIIR